VTVLLIELARGKKMGYTLESLIKDLKEPKESVEFRMNIMLEDFKAYGQSVLDKLFDYAKARKGWKLEAENYEGVRVNLTDSDKDGWFLLRLSLHDPLLPLNIESNVVGGAKRIAKEINEFIKDFENLNSKTLSDFVK
jgi:phosphomannomutase